MIFPGLLEMPHELNGHWNDHSSQSVSKGFHGSTAKFEDNVIKSSVYLPDLSKPLVSPGWHRVSIALLWPATVSAQDMPDSTGTLFKVMGARSC